MSEVLTTEEFRRCISENNKSLHLIGEYTGSKRRISIQCECGEIFHPFASAFSQRVRSGSGTCRKCAAERKSDKAIRKKIRYYRLIDTVVLKHGKRLNDPAVLLCKKHKVKIKVRNLSDLISNGCRKCKKEKRTGRIKYKEEAFAKLVYKLHGKKIKLHSGYTSSSKKAVFECSKGHVFEAYCLQVVPASNHVKPQGCKVCSSSKGPYSKVAGRWLTRMGRRLGGRFISYPTSGKEYTLPLPNPRGAKGIRVDGYVADVPINIVFEFLGDYWHGNPRVFERKRINPTNKLSFGRLYTSTKERLKTLADSGCIVVYIWESDFHANKKPSMLYPVLMGEQWVEHLHNKLKIRGRYEKAHHLEIKDALICKYMNAEPTDNFPMCIGYSKI